MLDNDQTEDNDKSLQLMAELAADLLDSTNELIALLHAHKEQTWADNFSRFRDQLLDASSKKDLRKSLVFLKSFYGGMGSWNDVYLVALGEAEAMRSRLSGSITMKSERLLSLLSSMPDDSKQSIWQSLKRWLSG